jgi:hypothetical protein
MRIARTFKKLLVDKEWICIKIPLIFIWINVFQYCLAKGYSVPIPLGVCRLFNCSIFLEGFGLFLITAIAYLLSVAYFFDFKMKWVTIGLFVLSVIVFTSEESSGILNRNGTFSFLFLAQSFAYWLKGSNLAKLKHSRIQFSIQAVTVGYFLSACSKLLDSGLSWPIDGTRITLQVLKSFHYSYYTNLDGSELVKATEVIQFLNDSQNSMIAVLAASLLIEFFALTAAIDKTYARFYGFGLLLMHIGIHYFMGILIISFAVPMVIVLINPLYLVVHLGTKTLKNKTLPFRIKST